MPSHSLFELSVEAFSTDKGLLCASSDSDVLKPLTCCPFINAAIWPFELDVRPGRHDSPSCDQSTWQAWGGTAPRPQVRSDKRIILWANKRLQFWQPEAGSRLLAAILGLLRFSRLILAVFSQFTWLFNVKCRVLFHIWVRTNASQSHQCSGQTWMETEEVLGWEGRLFCCDGVMSSVITGKVSSAWSIDPGVNVACNHSHHFLESESTTTRKVCWKTWFRPGLDQV